MAGKGKKRKVVFLGRHIMLKGEYAGKLFSGEKRATVRLGIVRVRHPEVIIHAGGRPVAKARIREIIVKQVKDLTDDDARLDGFKSKEELFRELKKMYRDISLDDYVSVITFDSIRRLDEQASEDPYRGLSPGDLARIALRYLKDELDDEERRILLDLTRTNSIRLTATRLYGGVHRRKNVRRVLRRALHRLKELGVLG
ncbi:MAG: ASCH domain-containing protein [Desulfurococcales archaeon]|nr:ASCH domain-containing protein [Desulfurococcales archaeon]